MNHVRLYLHSEAIEELGAAFDWYIERSPQAAERFLNAVEASFAKITQNPQICSRYLYGTRRYLLKRFPFLIVFRENSQEQIQIVAVAHAFRRPGYWRNRE